jgi:hypothetical protein
MRCGVSIALLVGVTLIQCYATRTRDDCTPMSLHATTMAECRELASGYRKFDTRALRVTGLSVVVSYQCVAVDHEKRFARYSATPDPDSSLAARS